MNNTRFFAFLASVMLLCSVCLTFSGASVSASAAYYKTIPVQETESGVLTLQFARGPATFRIGENGHLYMSNYGGTWEFYSGSDD